MGGVDPDIVRPQWVQNLHQAQVHLQAHVIQQIAMQQLVDAELDAAIPLSTTTAERQRTYSSKQRISDAEVEEQLDKWVEYLRNHMYAEADMIRARLRAQGIDPDSER